MAEQDERLRRWRLVLGGEDADGTGLAQLTSAPGVYDRSVSCSAG